MLTLALLVICATPIAPPPPVPPIVHGLDGRAFTGTAQPHQGKETRPGDLSFAGGKLRATLNVQLGFGEADYTTEQAQGVTQFTAVAMKAGGVHLVWEGIVKGDDVEAFAQVLDGGKAKEQWLFRGKRKK